MSSKAQIKDINFYCDDNYSIDIHQDNYLPIEVIGDK